jgi:small subunit ribosomal protein S16
MVKVRLTRMGAKKAPFYRIIATDSRSPRDGRFLEILGYYDPITTPEIIHVKHERLQHWVSVGAQVSDTVASLLKRQRRNAPPASQS